MDSSLYTIFGNLLIDLPAHLVRLVGIILCFVYWRRYPRACLLTLIAILLFYLQTAIAIGVNLWVQRAARFTINPGSIAIYFRVYGFLNSIITAIAFGLLFAAIFWRDERPKTT